MIKSMTGFGLSNLIEKDSKIYIEIKGVNHRFLEISIKSNETNNDLDQYMRNAISKQINRGKIDVRLNIKSSSKTEYFINGELIKKLEKSAKKIMNLTELKFKDIKDIPGIVNIEVGQQTNINQVKKEFNKALKLFIDSRKKEGSKIRIVLNKKIEGIESLTAKILKANKSNLKFRIRLFKQKIKKLVEDFDDSKLSQEVVLLALKFDVAEELDRIFFHLKSLKEEVNKINCKGKKIDFLLQELFREANTLSVKLDAPKTKNLALDMKLLVEEMREQIQNVE
ncbi:MAG: YicC family protein [SAR86 cluster bacterium]|uniref:YicC family protein n=1 Tax=SAR86 cluster bacterium TaxID=2030880 RepID=A0A520MY97_9GAMM|nr:MAG: YicC family protein [SAR86 cluster bacterium]|tara:strand:+ start:718 stop:1563 length:846 start_codon:yes stop_codon:yes gene_type:complete